VGEMGEAGWLQNICLLERWRGLQPHWYFSSDLKERYVIG